MKDRALIIGFFAVTLFFTGFSVFQVFPSKVELSSTEVTITATVGDGDEDQGSNVHHSPEEDRVEEPEAEPVPEEEVLDPEDSEEEQTEEETPEGPLPLEERGEPHFLDIQSHWAEAYVKELYALNIVDGMNPEAFEPDALLTRAEMAKVIWRAFGDPEWVPTAATSFSDVPEAEWYSVYVSGVKEMGVVRGYTDGTFRPGASVNRAETLKMVVAAMGLNPSPSRTRFADVDPSSWYAPYVDWAYSQGIVRGKGEALFAPQDFTTRAEMAKIVVNSLHYLNGAN